MSFSISPVVSDIATADSQSLSSTAQAPVIKPTATEQILAMHSSGQSAAVIASSLGVTVAEVDTTLGITSSADTQASALSALAGRLSVQG